MKIKYKFSITVVKKDFLVVWWFSAEQLQTTVYKLKNENFYVQPNNKVSIAVELAELLSAKKQESYVTTISWVRAKVSFAILRS